MPNRETLTQYNLQATNPGKNHFFLPRVKKPPPPPKKKPPTTTAKTPLPELNYHKLNFHRIIPKSPKPKPNQTKPHNYTTQHNTTQLHTNMLPQVKGIGVDLLHLPRLTRLLTKRPTYAHRFARRILTKSEYRQFLKSSSPSTTTTTMGMVKWLGVRWAAKEAAFKAFGTRRGGLVWGDVEVGYYDSGWSLSFFFL